MSQASMVSWLDSVSYNRLGSKRTEFRVVTQASLIIKLELHQ